MERSPVGIARLTLILGVAGVFHDGTAFPVVGAIFACGLLAAEMMFLGYRGESNRGSEKP